MNLTARKPNVNDKQSKTHWTNLTARKPCSNKSPSQQSNHPLLGSSSRWSPPCHYDQPPQEGKVAEGERTRSKSIHGRTRHGWPQQSFDTPEVRGVGNPAAAHPPRVLHQQPYHKWAGAGTPGDGAGAPTTPNNDGWQCPPSNRCFSAKGSLAPCLSVA